MRKILKLTTSYLLASAVMTQVAIAQTEFAAAEEIVLVEMIDKSPTEFTFDPVDITVRRGATVRFVMTGNVPHNIQFKDPPEGARLDEIMMGPFLVQQGQTYDVVIDDRFVDGLYPVVCTPHELMGMKGTLTVIP